MHGQLPGQMKSQRCGCSVKIYSKANQLNYRLTAGLRAYDGPHRLFWFSQSKLYGGTEGIDAHCS